MPSKHEILVRHILRFGLVILQADFHLEKLDQNTEDRLPHPGHTITRGVDENIENTLTSPCSAHILLHRDGLKSSNYM